VSFLESEQKEQNRLERYAMNELKIFQIGLIERRKQMSDLRQKYYEHSERDCGYNYITYGCSDKR